MQDADKEQQDYSYINNSCIDRMRVSSTWNLESSVHTRVRKQKLTEGAKVQVLVPCHPPNPGLPSAVLVMPACMGKARATRKIIQAGMLMRVYMCVCECLWATMAQKIFG